ILLRPGLMMSGSNYTNPLMRGVAVRRTLLCAPLPKPSQTIVNERAQIVSQFSHESFTSREIATRVTGEQRCSSCHDKSNSIGFALEGFGPHFIRGSELHE
ncbi:MAG: DUF1588 domain-containing protein, partial [Cytophagaceae bacterium]